MKKGLLALTFVLTVNFCMKAQHEITGIWYNTVKTGKVEIFEKNNKFYGKIVWLKEPLSEKNGKPKVDENNPDKNKQNQPVVGLQVMQEFEFEGKGVYKKGTIYDPENGKTYKCILTLIDNKNLDVRGYIGIPSIGRTEKWTRAEG
jgi:uncharacterized protein (DUF2147 family)